MNLMHEINVSLAAVIYDSAKRQARHDKLKNIKIFFLYDPFQQKWITLGSLYQCFTRR